MKLHRRDRGKCLHAVNEESQGDFFSFLFYLVRRMLAAPWTAEDCYCDTDGMEQRR